MAADLGDDNGMYKYGMIMMEGERIEGNKEGELKYLKIASQKVHEKA